MKRVVSQGAVAMDVVIESQDLPRNDGFSLISKETLLPGGSSSNVTVALKNLGVQGIQLGKIGDDKYGQIFYASLHDEGVNVDHLIQKENGITLHNYVFTASDGSHSIMAHLGDTVYDLKPEEIPENIFNQVDCFYTDLFSAEAGLFLGKKAKGLGVPVVFNLQCPPDLMAACHTPFEAIEEMLSLADIFVTGRGNYQLLTGEADPIKAVEVLRQTYGIDDAICTLGSKGALWGFADRVLIEEGFPVEAVDTTGAGDAFLAGLIDTYYISGESREKALAFACGLGALKCLEKGPRSHVTREDVIKLITHRQGVENKN